MPEIGGTGPIRRPDVNLVNPVVPASGSDNDLQRKPEDAPSRDRNRRRPPVSLDPNIGSNVDRLEDENEPPLEEHQVDKKA